MYIIDKHTDYYDHFSYIYGVDKKVTFDRRGSIVLTDEIIWDNSVQSDRYSFLLNRNCKIAGYSLLEIGTTQYLIKIYEIKKHKNELGYNVIFDSCKMEIVKIFKENKHYFNNPISIHGVNIKTYWGNRKAKYKKIIAYQKPNATYQESISSVKMSNIAGIPILKDTQLTSLINPEEIWKDLQNYISSLDNDKDINIKLTDVEKTVNHGFDKKTSFRHPVK